MGGEKKIVPHHKTLKKVLTLNRRRALEGIGVLEIEVKMGVEIKKGK